MTEMEWFTKRPVRDDESMMKAAKMAWFWSWLKSISFLSYHQYHDSDISLRISMKLQRVRIYIINNVLLPL